MAKRGLSHIALKTRDLKKTEDFYLKLLGLKVAFRHPPSMIFLTTPGSGDLLNFVKTSRRSSGNYRPQRLPDRILLRLSHCWNRRALKPISEGERERLEPR